MMKYIKFDLDIRFRNVNCATWRNSCIGDRTIVYLCRKL